MDNLTRRNVRYICFRLQTEAEGGTPATIEETGIMQYVEEIKKLMEGQPEFEGWKKFAKTWDVDERSPLIAVNRLSSIQSDWNKVLKKEAKDLPAAEPKKNAQRGPGGRFVSKRAKPKTEVLLPPEPSATESIPSTVSADSPPPTASEGQGKKKFWEILK